MQLQGYIRDLRIKELEIFQAVARARSVREAARRLNLTPGEVSKAIRSLENKIGVTLLKRSSTGVLLSEAGAQIALLVDEMLDTAIKLDSYSFSPNLKKQKRQVSVAATSFLITYLLAPELTKLFSKNDNHVFRFLDLSPDEMAGAGLRGAFDIGFHFAKIDWPSTWSSRKVGSIEWVLCARKGHPLSDKSTLDQVLQYPFVLPTYWSAEGLAYGNDHFPIALNRRIKGYETGTADAALPVVAGSDQLAFLPRILAQSYVDRGLIKVCHIKDLEEVKKDLYLTVRTDRILIQLYETMCKHFEEILS